MATNVVIILAFLLFPALVIWLCAKFPFLNKIGIVLLCYIVGMIVGNIGILPSSFDNVQSLMQDVSVSIALPLLLFSLDVKKWIKMSSTALFCMLLAIIAIIITTFALQLTIGSNAQDGWKLAGMSVAVYTGGTPNLAAIKSALQVSNATYILFNTYDTVFSLIYIFFMASVARIFFQKVFKLKPYKFLDRKEGTVASDISDESIEAYFKMFKPSILKGLLLAFFVSATILAIAVVLGSLFPKNFSTAITILLITSLGIASSFIRPIRRIKYSFQFGMYIIYLFCFTVASMTKLSVLIHINWDILLYVLFSILGSVLLHALMCKWFKIDSDTMIVTSVSAMCSPPFVPVVVNGLKNKDVLIGGLVTGIIGYAIGNYLAIAVAMLYRVLFA
ncbi:DUF819 family protein [Bacillus sp. 165]|uniref:DUF819 family protein n=1 Tax=Bacillus sp. 165 TaxID=1529117 RepID=UPI001AD9E8C4|nr:DUF819 family protein [Bacillus sp. 165]MBO9128547.1 DUF819 family protein [Bacillus sp. 165]